MRTLYIDMNSFFASVEQEAEPALRGRPVAITAIESDAGACVAASYEAKAFGIKTGTRIHEAKRLCPHLVLRPSRHKLYVRINQKIAAVIDHLAELEFVRSIDEFQVVLAGHHSELETSLQLARQIKAAISTHVGSQLRCSIGIGPNHLLAKIAGKLEKPDGLVWLAPENMPDRIDHLKLDDLPGISKGIRRKLLNAQIYNVRTLYRLDPRHARMIWRSVEGERFIRALQGMDIRLNPNKRNGYGNSKVLAPELRSPDKAKLVGRWLTEKACERMRRDDYCARLFSLQVNFRGRPTWSNNRKLTASQDTAVFLQIYESLWTEMLNTRPNHVLGISVHLGNIIELSARSGELFTPLAPGQQSKTEALAKCIDNINRRYKSRLLKFGV
ncbi:MAG: UMUC-like DNA-repair protein [Pseudomonadota bacterium]